MTHILSLCVGCFFLSLFLLNVFSLLVYFYFNFPFAINVLFLRRRFVFKGKKGLSHWAEFHLTPFLVFLNRVVLNPVGLFELETSILPPFQEITYPHMCFYLPNKMPSLLGAQRVPCIPFSLTSTSSLWGTGFQIVKGSDVKGGLSCPSTSAGVTNLTEVGGKWFLICLKLAAAWMPGERNTKLACKICLWD